MPFNLDKKDQSAKADPIKKTGFNLTKEQASPVIPAQQPKKSRTFLWVLLSLLLIGSTIWFITSNPKEITPDAPIISEAGSDKTQNVDGAGSNDIGTSASSVTENEETSSPQMENGGQDATPAIAEPTAKDVSAGGEKQDRKVAASFQKGSADAYMIDKSVVADIARFLGANPGSVITLNGYASSEGPIEVNQQISQARADAFKTYLVSKGIDQNQILATGKGIEDPVATNETEQGRKKNRRVEILLK